MGKLIIYNNLKYKNFLKLAIGFSFLCYFLFGCCSGIGYKKIKSISNKTKEDKNLENPTWSSQDDKLKEQVVCPNLNKIIVASALDLENKKLAYSKNPDKYRDCSGVFHRVLDKIKNKCKNFKCPDKTSRSSRDLAKWYFSNKKLTIVTNPLKQDKFIKEGTAVFYGYVSSKKKKKLTPDEILNSITHVGIVVGVKKDSHQRVLSYELFHAQSNGKPASITNRHERNPKKFSPFGNGSQELIAIAYLS